METIIIIGGLVIGLIVVLGRLQHAKAKAKTQEAYDKAIIAQEKSIANETVTTVENSDLADVIDIFNGMYEDKSQDR